MCLQLVEVHPGNVMNSGFVSPGACNEADILQQDWACIYVCVAHERYGLWVKEEIEMEGDNGM